MGLGDTLGAVWNGVTGQSDFHADPYQVNSGAFQDPNAAANKQSLAAALAARQQQPNSMAHAAMMDQAQQGQTRGQQMSFVGALQNQMAGNGPSVAQGQMQQGMQQEIQSQASQAASARGVSPALAAKLAAENVAGAQQQNNAQMGQLRSQEQLSAQQQLGSVLSGARGQDIGNAQFNAGNQQQTNMGNMQAQMQQQQQRDQMAQFYTSQGMSIDQAQFMAQQQLEAMKMQAYNANQSINAGVAQQNAQGTQQFIGGLISAGGALGAAGISSGANSRLADAINQKNSLASDRNLKTDIADGDADSRGFLEAIKAKRFRYKGDAVEHLGVMAQDVEKAPGGAGMVINTPRGKMIDVPQAVGRLLATSASLHDRIKKIETKRRARDVARRVG